MEEKVALISFTDRGAEIARSIQTILGGDHTEAKREVSFSLSNWAEQAFGKYTALVFVGAAGIAVRAISPWVRSKAADPAVLCVDEAGRFVIPLLSGHLGGANALAEKLAERLGATAVITTATDLRHAFAVDLWAKKQELAVLQPERIKTVSAKVLQGEQIQITCPWPVAGEPPSGVRLADAGDVVVDYRPQPGRALQLAPRVLYLGIGCRRGTDAEHLETVFQRFCGEKKLLPEAIRGAASIDLKADEPGLLAFCQSHAWPLTCFDAETLASLEGDYSPSEFVKSTVGVDNVCERSAVLASGGELIEKKYAFDGVTFALALRAPELDWSW